MTRSHVYDKAKWHYQGEYPPDLPIEQAFVHTGMFLGWIIDQGLYSEEFEEDSAEQIDAFKRRGVTGPQIYGYHDGVLIDDMLSDEGNRFARHYFEFETGQYLVDYEELLARGLPSTYHVADTWDNYDKIADRINERYVEWRRVVGDIP